MSNTIISIPKGLDRPIEIKGLKGDCIAYATASFIALLLAFAFLYLIKVPMLIRLTTIGAAAVVLIYRINRINKRYTPHGGMKRFASKWIPPSIRADTRTIFKEPTDNT